MTHNGQRLRGPLVSCCTALVLLAAPAYAGQDPPPSQQQQPNVVVVPSSPDFLLGRPHASIGVRGNWLMATAGSDIYDFVSEHLTIEKSDFNTATFATDLAIYATPRLDIVAGFEVADSEIPSEYRGYSETVSGSTTTIPIQQVTELQQMHFTGSVKFGLLPRGKQVSRLAWIPRTFVPYVGAGAGVTRYTFRQTGDFVDFATENRATGTFRIFTDIFESQGWAPSLHAFAGTDIMVFKRLYLTLEGRYTSVYAELDQDFIDFEPMDLSGFRFGAGINFVF
jgi:opacity protein-like surface antigen